MVRAGLTVVVSDDYRTHKKTPAFKFVAETQHILIVSNSEVAANFIFLNINGAYDNYDFCVITHLHKHLKFAVRHEPWQNAACMIVVEEFPSEFEV